MGDIVKAATLTVGEFFLVSCIVSVLVMLLWDTFDSVVDWWRNR